MSDRLLLAWVLGLSMLLGAPTCGNAPVGPSSVTVGVGNFTLTYTLSTSQRLSRTTFEYVYTAQLTNNGPTVATGAGALVSSQAQTTVVTDNALSFGNLNPGQTVASLDTFTIEQDRTVPFVPADLVFQINAGTGGGMPTPPTGLGAIAGSGRAMLAWDPDPSPQAGYHVYSSPTAASLTSFNRVNATLLTQPGFTDTSLTDGVETFFVVTTVIGNAESPFSAPVGVLPPSLQTSPVPITGADTRLSTRLADFKRLVAGGDSVASAASAASIPLALNGDLILRGFADSGSAAALVGALQAVGAQGVTADGPIAHFTLPPSQLDALVTGVAISAVEAASPPAVEQGLPMRARTEGARTIGADDLAARGITGKNVKVAVKDVSFNYTGNLLDTLTRPNIQGNPPVVTRRFCPNGNHNAACPAAGTADRFEEGTSRGNHGDAVVEIVHDVAPDAEILLYAPWNAGEYLGAVNDAVAQGARIATASMTYPAPEDDVDATSMRMVAANGIAASQLVMTQAAGNSGEYMAANDTFNPDTNGYHIWNSALFPTAVMCDVIDPTMTATSVRASCLPMSWFPGNTRGVYLSYNQWPLATVDDLDLYLYGGTNGALDANGQTLPGANVCACSTQSVVAPVGVQTPPTEYLGATVQGSAVYLVVHRKATANAQSRPRFRMYPSGFANFKDAGGNAPPGAIPSTITATDAAATNILAVGATRWNTDRVELYSSRGPVVNPATGTLTRAKPDLAGPACTTSGPLSPEFCGTSASTPHVAGAAALLIEWCGTIPCTDSSGAAVDPANPADIRRLLLDKAVDVSHVPITHGPNDIPNAWGAGRVDVTPPIVFRGSDGQLYRRDATNTADTQDGLALLPFVGEHPTVSPDGTRLAFQSRVGSSFEIFVADLYDPAAQPVQLTFGGTIRAAFHPAWSPDGQQIAYIERNRYNVGSNIALAFTLDIVNADGSGKDHRVLTFNAQTADNPGAAFPDWSETGEIAFTLMTPQAGSNGVRYTSYEIATVDATAANLRFPDPAISVLTPGIRPRWGREGGYLAYMTLNDPNPDLLPFPLSFTQNPTVRLIELISGMPIPGGFPGAEPAWSPAGSRLVFTRNPTEGQPVDPGHFHLFQGWFDNDALGMGPVLPFVGLVDELQLTNTITLGRIQGTSVPGQDSPSW